MTSIERLTSVVVAVRRRPQHRCFRFVLLATVLALTGCSAANVSVAPDASRIATGTRPPEGSYEQLGAVTGTHGGGCGLYGARGDFEGAHAKLRNKAAAMGADYVQIVRVVEPRLEGICMNQSFTIDGIAYRRRTDAGAARAPAVPATTQPPQRTGLDGTYAGEITGNAQGRAFTMRVSFTVVQSGEQIAGAWTTTGGASGTITGILTESGIRDLRARQLNPCAGEFGGVAVVEAGGNRLRGSYVGRDCGGPVTASFTVDRQ